MGPHHRNDGVQYLAFLHASKSELLRHGWFRSLCIAGVSTLSLGCMGSAVLPLAAAFVSTGILVGFGTCLLVCAVNVYTSRLLLRQARLVGAYDYESLGHLVGGFWYQKVVEVSNGALLFCTIIGGIAQLAEAGTFAVRMLWCDPNAGLWLLGPVQQNGTYTGVVLVILYVVILAAPWSLLKEMKELEYAGFLGYPVVLFLTFSIVARCIKEGFPAIRNGSLPLVGFTGLSNVSSTVSIWAFAFYIQPVMMPLYAEMPPGNVGLHATGIAMSSTLMGTALIPYLLIGFFGAALFGPAADETGNVLMNDIYGHFGPDGQPVCPARMQGALNILMTVYLAVTIPPIEFALRHIVNTWVSQLRKRFHLQRFIPKRDQGFAGWLRNVFISMFNLTTSTIIALACSSNSEQFLTIAGATSVLLVSFVLPVSNHFLLLSGRARCQKDWQATQGGTRLLRQLSSTKAAAAAAAKDVERGGLDSIAEGGKLPSAAAGSGLSPHPSVEDSCFVATDSETIPAALAWGSLSRANSAASKSLFQQGSRAPSFLGGDQDGQLLQAARALSKITRVDPESMFDDAPLTNTFHAYKFADPMSYRNRAAGVTFWALDVLVPLLVLCFGVLCSICTLMGVHEDITAARM